MRVENVEIGGNTLSNFTVFFKTVIALIVLRFEKGMMFKNQINEQLKAAS